MARRDEDDEDDRPRRRPRDEDDEPPRRRRSRDEDDDDRMPPRKKSNLGLILGIVAAAILLVCGGVITLGYFAAKKVGDDFKKAMQEVGEPHDNFVEIGLGFHAHEAGIGGFPQNSYDQRGQPLLSWRVHLLPFVGEDALYKRFNLKEAWNSPTNMALLKEMPDIYGSPETNVRAGAGKTFYRGFTHQGALFEKPFEKPRQPGGVNRVGVGGVPDGLTNTIFVVEAGEAVEWTKPDDLDWSPGRPRPALGKPGSTYFHALMGDGSVKLVKKSVTDQDLRNLIGRNDAMVINPGWHE